MSTGERDKRAWREEILARRKAVPGDVRAGEAAALALHAGELAARAGESAAAVQAAHTAALRPAEGLQPGSETVWACAYVPVGSEPGSGAMLDALREGGVRVLLPVTGEPGPLEWAEYLGPEGLRRGRFGLSEPAGPPIPHGITLAALVLVPALAVDGRGVRLGRGAGYYDRSLAACREDARLIAVVRDDELVDRLPEEPHDRRMGWALTPGGGLRQLTDGCRN